MSRNKNLDESKLIVRGALNSESFEASLFDVLQWCSANQYARMRAHVAVCVCLCSGATLDELVTFTGSDRLGVWRYLREFERLGWIDRVRRKQGYLHHAKEGLRSYIKGLSLDIRRDSVSRLARGRALKCARRTDVDALLGMLGKQTGGE